jgi:hypothetical protein
VNSVPYDYDRLVFMTDKGSVYCAVRLGSFTDLYNYPPSVISWHVKVENCCRFTNKEKRLLVQIFI